MMVMMSRAMLMRIMFWGPSVGVDGGFGGAEMVGDVVGNLLGGPGAIVADEDYDLDLLGGGEAVEFG
jgi:hypothetical protein